MIRLKSDATTNRSSTKHELMVEQQTAFARSQVVTPNLKILARAQRVLNAVFMKVDAKAISAIAQDPPALRIASVKDHELHLNETIPYIGARHVQSQGFDGRGIKITVLDSGVDYTHINLNAPRYRS